MEVAYGKSSTPIDFGIDRLIIGDFMGSNVTILGPKSHIPCERSRGHKNNTIFTKLYRKITNGQRTKPIDFGDDMFSIVDFTVENVKN